MQAGMRLRGPVRLAQVEALLAVAHVGNGAAQAAWLLVVGVRAQILAHQDEGQRQRADRLYQALCRSRILFHQCRHKAC